jgi:hypothetical protein
VSIPDEFLQLARGFHQDSRIGVANEQEWIAARLASLKIPRSVASSRRFSPSC